MNLMTSIDSGDICVCFYDDFAFCAQSYCLCWVFFLTEFMNSETLFNCLFKTTLLIDKFNENFGNKLLNVLFYISVNIIIYIFTFQ
jgi:hypothetical protein